MTSNQEASCSSYSWHTLPPPSFIFFLEMDKVWVNSGNRWWTGRPGMLRSMGSQSRTKLSNWTKLNWTEIRVHPPPDAPSPTPGFKGSWITQFVYLRPIDSAYDNTHIYLLFCCIALFYFVQWDQCTYCSMPFYLLKNVQHTDCSINKYYLTRGYLSPFRAFILHDSPLAQSVGHWVL